MTDVALVQARFRTALDLFDAAYRMKRQNLRRRNPEAGEAEIEAMVRAWLRDRPGAEHGDAEGTPVEWPRRE